MDFKDIRELYFSTLIEDPGNGQKLAHKHYRHFREEHIARMRKDERHENFAQYHKIYGKCLMNPKKHKYMVR